MYHDNHDFWEPDNYVIVTWNGPLLTYIDIPLKKWLIIYEKSIH